MVGSVFKGDYVCSNTEDACFSEQPKVGSVPECHMHDNDVAQTSVAGERDEVGDDPFLLLCRLLMLLKERTVKFLYGRSWILAQLYFGSSFASQGLHLKVCIATSLR